MTQTTLSGYDRDRLTKYLLGLGWSYFDARCLMRTKYTRHEAERIKSGRITRLQRNLLFDDKFRRDKLEEMLARMRKRRKA